MLKIKKQTWTAVTIKDHVIRYVRGKNESLESVSDFGERYLPKGVVENGRIKEWDTLVTIFQECVDTWNLKKQKVVFTVPDSLFVIREHSVDITVKDEETTGHLYMELGEKLHLPFEEPAFDWAERDADEKKRHLLLVAAPEDTVAEYTKLFEACKVKPLAADVAPLAFYRFYEGARYGGPEEHLLTVHAFPSHILVTVFNKDTPVVTRHMEWELDSQQWRVETIEDELIYEWTGSEEEIISSWQDVLTDIRKLRNYYESSYHKGEKSLTKVCIGGDHPYLSRFEEDMSLQFDIPVHRYDRTNLRVSNSDTNIPERYHETVGLLLKKEV
ncbi:pilus assembly protein PilM [Bacillus sp. H-16]|uniref:type IV pilus biogenesis protein PilM n=1 Tax=Alteribacter salitolerans TaxID=2912333 RepID=UPI0019626BF7|nr:pilus assembly protein PilM [Alteribacter salitolerans]MBM7098002.1 pilus assembly protein PilM [Alteribacter salitolerans]